MPSTPHTWVGACDPIPPLSAACARSSLLGTPPTDCTPHTSQPSLRPPPPCNCRAPYARVACRAASVPAADARRVGRQVDPPRCSHACRLPWRMHCKPLGCKRRCTHRQYHHGQACHRAHIHCVTWPERCIARVLLGSCLASFAEHRHSVVSAGMLPSTASHI